MPNCPIIEQTGDGTPVGKCDFYLEGDTECPRHGDVSVEAARFLVDRKLTLEDKLRERRGQPPLKTRPK